MRTKEMFVPGVIAAVATLALAGCGNLGEGAQAPATSNTASTSGISQPAPSSASTKSSPSSSSSKSPSPTKSPNADGSSQGDPSSSGIVNVPESDFTPADGPNARVFKLADGTTKCFMNNLAGESFLSCQAAFVDPPLVTDGQGREVPANAVSWHTGGVTYETLTFPATGDVKTLEPNQRLQAFGYTCTAYGPSSLECSGAPGTASINNGTVTGASVPNKAPENSQQPAPAGSGAPAGPLGPVGPVGPAMNRVLPNTQ